MLVTILTPIFNGIEYFDDCYNGIISQTDINWIWHIGINGHGDNTNDIFQMLQHKIQDKRIIIKNYTTKGKVNTLHEMMKEVTTDYIALCDIDDIWFPTKLEIQKLFLEKYPFVDVFGTNLQYIGELNHIPNLPHGRITLDTLFKINPVVNSSIIMKKECCLWENTFAGLDDYDLWFRLLIHNKIIVTIPEPFIYHRVYKESAFNNSGVQDISGLLNYYNKYLYDVTVVTAYYPIKSKFSIQHYIQCIQQWSSIICNLVFYTTKEYVPIIENIRKDLLTKTKVIPLDFEKLDAIQKYGYDFWENEYNKDHEKYHTPELYILWYEKKGFVKKAIESNYFNTSKFIWCDAGIFRNKDWIQSLEKFPIAHNIPNNKFAVLRITDFEKEEKDNYQMINCVGGGILAASKDVWLEFYDLYDSVIQEYIQYNKFVGKDQSIIASIIIRKPDFFQIINKIPQFDDYMCWFSLLFYFSINNISSI